MPTAGERGGEIGVGRAKRGGEQPRAPSPFTQAAHGWAGYAVPTPRSVLRPLSHPGTHTGRTGTRTLLCWPAAGGMPCPFPVTSPLQAVQDHPAAARVGWNSRQSPGQGQPRPRCCRSPGWGAGGGGCPWLTALTGRSSELDKPQGHFIPDLAVVPVMIRHLSRGEKNNQVPQAFLDVENLGLLSPPARGQGRLRLWVCWGGRERPFPSRTHLPQVLLLSLIPHSQARLPGGAEQLSPGRSSQS